jgi:hypothetical protein
MKVWIKFRAKGVCSSVNCHYVVSEVRARENVLNEKRCSERQWEKHCKMKFRIVKTGVTNSFGEGFNILAYKETVKSYRWH